MYIEIREYGTHAYCILPNGRELYARSMDEIVETLRCMASSAGMELEFSERKDEVSYNV